MSAALPIALAFIMFSLGIGLTLRDFGRVFAMPSAICVGAVCQVLLIPLTAFALVKLTQPAPEIALGIMILSFCPGGVTSNIMAKLAGGNVALSISLTGIISLLSVVTIPLLVAASAAHFLGEEALDVDAGALGIAMFLITALPAGLGIMLRHFQPDITLRYANIVVNVATALFVVIVVASIAANWAFFVENFAKLGPLMIGMNVALFVIGYGVARAFALPQKNQITIALETGVQNSALGITIGALLVESGTQLPAYSLPAGVYGVTFYFVTLPFILWARRQMAD